MVGALKREHKKISKLAALSPRKVRAIRNMSAAGKTQSQLATQFGISQASIHNILVGKTYRGVL